MDKRIVGVIGAITGLAALDQAAQATPSATPTPDPMNARSFAELLDPIPNALAALRAADAAARETENEAVHAQDGNVQVAGWHHHHHHNRWRSQWWWRHHHHHHHHRVIIIPRWHHHHNHHHHHHHHMMF